MKVFKSADNIPHHLFSSYGKKYSASNISKLSCMILLLKKNYAIHFVCVYICARIRAWMSACACKSTSAITWAEKRKPVLHNLSAYRCVCCFTIVCKSLVQPLPLDGTAAGTHTNQQSPAIPANACTPRLLTALAAIHQVVPVINAHWQAEIRLSVFLLCWGAECIEKNVEHRDGILVLSLFPWLSLWIAAFTFSINFSFFLVIAYQRHPIPQLFRYAGYGHNWEK